MRLLVVLFLLFGCNTKKVHATDGKTLYRKCIHCHGRLGQGKGMFPKLRGQNKGYLIKQIKDIKSGKRKVPQMRPYVKRLSNEDIKAIAEYLSKLGDC
jgi:cytochrome c